MQSPNFAVIIIGAGAAGLMCAQFAAAKGLRTLILDHSSRLAEKIRISGGGRCNFTNLNASPANYISNNPHFATSALSLNNLNKIRLIFIHRQGQKPPDFQL